MSARWSRAAPGRLNFTLEPTTNGDSMSSATMDTEELARLALGGRALKNRRVRRAIIARLINENGESYEGDESEEGDEEEETATGGGEDREMLRLLIGSKMLRRRTRPSRAVSRICSGRRAKRPKATRKRTPTKRPGGEGRELVRALDRQQDPASPKGPSCHTHPSAQGESRDRVRGIGDSETEGDEETGDEGGGEDREIVRALIASKMLRRRRVRRALLTHLLREKEEAVA